MTRRTLQLAAIALLACTTSWTHAHEGHDPPEPVNAVSTKVLLLGDSISMGYTPIVQEMLQGEAVVVRPDENCGPTTRGLERLESWLGDEAWDVIHFNFGLHDLKHVDTDGRITDPGDGAIQVPLDQYERNLDQIVQRLQETGAKLIWCTTTPVPEGAMGRIADDAVPYNAVALRVMRQQLGEDRIVNDLHTFAAPRLAQLQGPANVHFTKEGSRQLAQQVVSAIQQQLHPSNAATEVARGVVFHDENANGIFDSGDMPLNGIKVSNGQLITTTDAQGTYELPVTDDAIIFVIKPRDYRTPLDDKQLPQFYYVHKPSGSPASQYAGVAPTGPLPASIDFPLYRQREPNQFRAIMFGDPQPRDQREVDYIAHDVVEELVGTDASFGVTLGDITFDDLDLFEPQARAIAILGIPWYNVIGNHDINYDARADRHSDESFERVFGPAYYSFDYGPVHFLVVDDVEWLIDEVGKGRYQGGLGKRQMEFIRRDLAAIPPDQLVVLMMHIPLTDVRDRHELYRLIEQRPFCMSISAHTHTHEHRYITTADGWRGPKPHHHVINVTVSGGWWTGKQDERGIPHATMADGAPNGYSIISFDGQDYQLDFKAAGRSRDYQMAIHMPELIDPESHRDLEIMANVFNGDAQTSVKLTLADRPLGQMKYVRQFDPSFVQLFEHENALLDKLTSEGIPPERLWRHLPKPGPSSHLWQLVVPIDHLQDGTHVVKVEATLADGRKVTGHRLFRIERSPTPALSAQ